MRTRTAVTSDTPAMTLMPASGRALVALADEPARLAAVLQGWRDVDVAEALDALEPDDAAHVVAALPLRLAIGVLDSGVLHDFPGILERLTDRWAGQLLEGVAPVRRAAIFRTLDAAEGARLRAALSPSARLSLDALLAAEDDGMPVVLTGAALGARERGRRRRRRRRARPAIVLGVLLLVAALALTAALAALART